MTRQTTLDEGAATVLAMRLAEAARSESCPDSDLARLFIARAKRLIEDFNPEPESE